MADVRKNEIVFVTGRKGSGKSTFAARSIRALVDAGRRVVVVSPVGEFVDERGRPALGAGAAIVSTTDLTAWEMLRGRSVLVLPESDDVAAFAFRFAWAAASCDRPLILVVDEIDLYLSQFRPDPCLAKIIRYGRHRCLSLWGIAQRPANVHKDLLAQADRVVMFAARQPSDVDYLAKLTGVDPDQVRNLGLYQSVEIGQGVQNNT